MAYLLLVSLIWGFSFGLVKAEFAALSPAVLSCARLLIALPLFLPFIKAGSLRDTRLSLGLLATGALQYGFMYLTLFHAFRWLSGYEVALLTSFTPFYVIALHALLERKRPPAWFWWTAGLAVAGALWIFQPSGMPGKWPGIVLMQASNIGFATGQVLYRHLRHAHPAPDRENYALLFLGGALFTLPFALAGSAFRGLAELDASQWQALLYLGTVASGLGFFLWNAGARRVNPATLAVFNNLKIPLATLIAILVFGETARLELLIPGLIILVLALGWAELAHRRALTNGTGPKP